MATEDQKFVHQIRDQFYHIEIWFYNEIEGENPFFLPFKNVEGLAIEETLMNWGSTGWLVLKSDYEIFERGALAVETKTISRPAEKAPYIFRTDGRNRVSIKIYPIHNPTELDVEDKGDDLSRKVWEMNYDFVIYDMEDLPTKDPQRKKRKLYFYDERYQVLKERNIEWSTAIYGPNNGAANTPDSQRAMPANLAIKSIIKTAASSTSDGFNPDLKVGYKEGGTIDKPDIEMSSFGDWDEGPTSDPINKTGNDILYTSPAYSNALQDLNYAYSNAMGKDGTPVILRFGRNNIEKQWTLNPLSYYAKNATKNQIEHLILEDAMDGTTTPPHYARAPLGQGNGADIQNFVSGIASRIKHYQYVPMTSIDNDNIVNRPVINFDFSKAGFDLFYEGNTAEDVDKNLENWAKQGLHSYSVGGQVLNNVNKTKTSGLMTIPHFTAQTFFNKLKSSVQMLKDIVFLNQALYFQAPGLTFRTPGKFIFVDRVTSTGEKNPFDDRFLGQWMLIKVAHLFTTDKYMCDVFATKVDAHSKLWNNIDKSS
jgi:hypothetical protein